MLLSFASSSPSDIPLHYVGPEGLDPLLATLPPAQALWVRAQGFGAGAGEAVVVPSAEGTIALALVGKGSAEARRRGRFLLAAGAAKLPQGQYVLRSGAEGQTLENEALGWLLEGYRFARYKAQGGLKARLVAPEGPNAAHLEALAAAESLTRDLINTPASDMGPAELAAAACALAERFGGSAEVIEGGALLEQNFPMIHAVGRAATAARAPRLIDLRFGAQGPKLTLVGKGVCFDTGGLDLKPSSSMGLMKKDMGGAATVLGLTQMILASGLKVQLRVLIPAVENAVSADSFRPQDVLTARNGLTVEINNTDAEGRLVLADALAYASEENPDLVISMATLTGAARVALGPDVPPFFTDEEELAAAVSQGAAQAWDPVWRLPLHAVYEANIEPSIADLDNAPAGGMAGAITAALFLRRFVTAPYMHFDIYGWQPAAAPARPKGGVGQGARALLAALPQLLKGVN